jgi:predicted nucleic acid-binding protein
VTAHGRVVLDTDVLRFTLSDEPFRRRVVAEFPLWSLSAVVAHELRRAARPAAIQAVDGLLRRVARRIEPAWSDWLTAAEYLAHLGAEGAFDPDSVPRHQNDCLIAASSWRNGLPVVTCNGDDFARIAAFLKRRAGRLFVLVPPV